MSLTTSERREIGYVGADPSGLMDAILMGHAAEAKTVLVEGGIQSEQTSKETIQRVLIVDDKPDFTDHLVTKLKYELHHVSLTEPKSGREKRRERRKAERKSKFKP